jgi:phage/plasmid-like protein (TIGR03299 family)
MATTYLTGAQVVVCDNTLKAALKDEDAAKLRIRHSTRSELRVADARQALDLLEATAKAFEGYVCTLAEISVDDRAWSTFLRAHFPLKNESTFKTHPQFDRRAALNFLWREDPRVAPWSGTAYGVLAAVNTYEHHVSKGTSERSRAERNATRAINGRFDEIDTKTLGTLSTVLPGDAKLAAVVGPGAAH